MEKIKVIQDIKTKEYYWRGRVDVMFIAELKEAKRFDTDKEIEEEFDLMATWDSNVFADRFLEVKTLIVGIDFSYD